MNILIQPTAIDAARRVGELIAAGLRAKPNLVLGLATGRTMEPVYAELARLHRDAGLDFSKCRSFNLDEYVGLECDNPGSFHSFMQKHLVSMVNIDADRVDLPRGDLGDPDREAARYEHRIQAAFGIDLQLLGIGENGHIGFNEPGTPRGARTHVAVLTETTRRQNAAMFGASEAVPARAITMGIGTILDARRIVMLATGHAKASAIARAIEGPVTEHVPSSALQRHQDCVIVLDEEAAVALSGCRRNHPA